MLISQILLSLIWLKLYSQDGEAEKPVELTPSGRVKRKSCVKVDYAAFGDDLETEDPNRKETQEEIDRWLERLEKAVEK